jgi:hypothetical protein
MNFVALAAIQAQPRNIRKKAESVSLSASNASPARTALPAAHFERNEAQGWKREICQ